MLLACFASVLATGYFDGTAAETAPVLRCGTSTSTTVTMNWDAVPATDLYYVGIVSSASPGERPYAIQTTATTSATVLDLVPDTAYYFTLRSHPSEFNIVWGWRQPAVAVSCSTSATRRGAPHGLRRRGDRPNERSIGLEWRAATRLAGPGNATSAGPAAIAHEVGIRTADTSRWRWEPADAATTHLTSGLAAGTR